MNEVVKQRCVGIAVLIVMMVVVVPWLLDRAEVGSALDHRASVTSAHVMKSGEGQHAGKPFVVAALASNDSGHLASLAIHKNKPLVLHQQTKAVVPKVVGHHVDKQIVAKKVKASKPSKSLVVKPSGWYVQSGSFANRTNAESMVASLTKKRFASIIKRYMVGGQSVYRVYVGPFAQRDQAVTAAKPLVSRQVPIVVQIKG
jgi:DedD protein